MRELIINGVTVDLDEKTQMDLQFVSFLFTSINSISAPRSWTVSLPKSAVNMGLIQGASSGDYAGNGVPLVEFPYKNYTVDYYNRGFRLINDGKAILTKIGQRIEFVFTFGKAFEKIKLMSETKLTSLTETATDYLTWNRSINLNNMTAGFGWCNFYSFTNEDRTFTTANADIPFSVLHPTVTFDYIMNKIAELFSVSLIGLSALVGGCSFPLRNFDGVSVVGEQFTDSTSSNATTIFFTPYTGFYTLTFGNKFQNKNIQAANVKLTASATSTKPFYVEVIAEDGTIMHYLDAVLIGANYVYNGFIEFNLDSKNNSFTLYPQSDYTANISISIAIETNIKLAYYNPSTTGGYFPIIPNLPDMTCSDFIFQAMQLAGVFPEVTDDAPNTINFFSADTIIDNIGIAKDWTNKLVKSTRRMGELSDAEFKFGNYAQRNTLAYKADETNLLKTGDALTVSNVNLELENKLVELKFAAGKRFSVSEKTIDYPLYDIKIDAGVLIRNPKTQSNDVLGKIVNVGGINYLQFTDDLLWSNIKATENYVAQQTLIDKPRYIKENFHLKPEDVYLFSAKIPIYLQQYGKYYAVMKLQYRESEFSECELLEIKNV